MIQQITDKAIGKMGRFGDIGKFILKVLSVILIMTAIAACTNTNTVNIMIKNPSKKMVTEAPVKLQMQQIYAHLQTDTLIAPILLNEKNQKIPYKYTADGRSIIFMATVRPESQKTFSINRKQPTFWINFMRFRRENVVVKVGK